MNIRRNNKRRFLKTHQSRRLALRFGLFLTWLALVIFLPKQPSDVVAIIGFFYGVFRWYQWGYDPKGYPKWGCFLQMKMLPLADETERSWTPEQKAQIAAQREKQMLLRAAEAEMQPEQELLRPATDAGENKSEEMLRPVLASPLDNQP